MRYPKKGMIGPVLMGVVGTAILLTLGAWQLQRLAWKEALIAEIEGRLAAPPAALPAQPTPGRDDYLRVRLSGEVGAGRALVLTTRRPDGPGYRVIVPIKVDAGRQVMADMGYAPIANFDESVTRASARGPFPGDQLTVTGALFWPDAAGSTPEPEIRPGQALFFSREVAPMAEHLGTEPTLVVVEAAPEVGQPMPLAEPLGAGLPNDHLGYAFTWFSLAAICAVMSALWGRSVLRQERG